MSKNNKLLYSEEVNDSLVELFETKNGADIYVDKEFIEFISLSDFDKKQECMLSLIASEVTTSIKEKRELEEMLENV